MNEKKTAPEMDRELKEMELLRKLLNADLSSCKYVFEIRADQSDACNR